MDQEIYQVDENNVLLVPFGQLIAHDISGLFLDIPTNDEGTQSLSNINNINRYILFEIVFKKFI